MLRLLILAASMLAATVPAAADRYKDCSQSADQDRSIRGCTQILKRGKRESRKIRSIAYTNRGLAYANMGLLDRAIADYDQAIKLNPRDAGAYANRGLAYANKGQHERAIEDFTKAIEFQPNFINAYFWRSQAYRKKSDIKRADADYWKAQMLKKMMARDDLMMFFYRDPKPELLLGFLDEEDKSAHPWHYYPPFIGFFGVVFNQYPEWTDRLVPVTPSVRLAEAVRAALRLSNRKIPAPLTERLAAAGSDETLKAELGTLPSSPRDLVILRPTHLDILWGASFASGDKLYVRKIFQFFAATADRSMEIALDVAAVATWMSGAGGDTVAKMKLKYRQDTWREIVFAASALWALVANAKRHAFVHEVLSEYAKNAKVSENSDGSVIIEGSLASWIVGNHLNTLNISR